MAAAFLKNGSIVLLSWELRIRLKIMSDSVARRVGIFYFVKQRSTLRILSNRTPYIKRSSKQSRSIEANAVY